VNVSVYAEISIITFYHKSFLFVSLLHHNDNRDVITHFFPDVRQKL